MQPVCSLLFIVFSANSSCYVECILKCMITNNLQNLGNLFQNPSCLLILFKFNNSCNIESTLNQMHSYTHKRRGSGSILDRILIVLKLILHHVPICMVQSFVICNFISLSHACTFIVDQKNVRTCKQGFNINNWLLVSFSALYM